MPARRLFERREFRTEKVLDLRQIEGDFIGLFKKCFEFGKPAKRSP